MFGSLDYNGNNVGGCPKKWSPGNYLNFPVGDKYQ